MLPRVLIVDNDEPIRLLTRAVLGEAFAVEAVGNIEVALRHDLSGLVVGQFEIRLEKGP